MPLEPISQTLDQSQVRLLDKLCAPAQAPQARHVVPSGPLGLLGGILDEIDETVMARRLILATPSGATLSLDVCNRRLLQIQTEGEDLENIRMTARDLTYAGVTDLKTLRETLSNFTSDQNLVIQLAPSTNSATLEDTGLAAATLRQSWATLHAPPTAPEAKTLSDMCHLSTDHVKAWLLDDPTEEDVQAVGGEDQIERLLTVLDGIEPTEIAQGHQTGCTFLTDQKDALLIVWCDEAIALFALSHDKTPAVLACLPW